MDEPINDLDIETLELLELLLVDYQGTVLLASHDRAFLNEMITSILVIEADESIGKYDGGYDDDVPQRPKPQVVESRLPAVASRDQSFVASEKRKKLSLKEKCEMEELRGQIKSLQSEIRELHAMMANPSFYRRDRIAIAQSNAKLTELELSLAAVYERWEVLKRMMG
jgi:ATP-binding cassette subfamily F protein uup